MNVYYNGIRNNGDGPDEVARVFRKEVIQDQVMVTELLPERSLKIRDHSPTGFAWGYEGSGPAQLALALLLNALPEDAEHVARKFYQAFKRTKVAKWTEISFHIPREEILEWVTAQL